MLGAASSSPHRASRQPGPLTPECRIEGEDEETDLSSAGRTEGPVRPLTAGRKPAGGGEVNPDLSGALGWECAGPGLPAVYWVRLGWGWSRLPGGSRFPVMSPVADLVPKVGEPRGPPQHVQTAWGAVEEPGELSARGSAGRR